MKNPLLNRVSKRQCNSVTTIIEAIKTKYMTNLNEMRLIIVKPESNSTWEGFSFFTLKINVIGKSISNTRYPISNGRRLFLYKENVDEYSSMPSKKILYLGDNDMVNASNPFGFTAEIAIAKIHAR